jgi:hypothetical protein
MKNIILIVALTLVSIGMVSCKQKTTNQNKNIEGYSIDSNKTEINWVAYKTTDKVPVKGKFTKVSITKKNIGKTFSETLDGTEFNIPISSLFTNNASRDYKLKTLFFGVMKNTQELTGTIHMTDASSGYVDFSMNGLTKMLPFTYKTFEKSIEINSIMDTDTWQAQAAIASINNACYELHKGVDGISKTWSDVSINLNVYFKK